MLLWVGMDATEVDFCNSHCLILFSINVKGVFMF